MRMLMACAAGLAGALLSGPLHAQGSAQYDTYRDAYGSPNYQGNLTPDADDRKVLGPSIGASDPFLTRTRPARGWGEVDDINGGFWEFQADRLRQRRQDAEEADARQRAFDAQRGGSYGQSGSSALRPPSAFGGYGSGTGR